MRIDVALVPAEAKRWSGAVCVVVDELRASSMIVRLLEGGVNAVVPAASLAEARRLARRLGPATLLAGERRVVRAPGFDLGNSPAEAMAAEVSGRTAVLSTRNGTGVLRGLPAGTPAFIGCLLNATAVARAAFAQARATGADLGIVCAGRGARSPSTTRSRPARPSSGFSTRQASTIRGLATAYGRLHPVPARAGRRPGPHRRGPRRAPPLAHHAGCRRRLRGLVQRPHPRRVGLLAYVAASLPVDASGTSRSGAGDAASASNVARPDRVSRPRHLAGSVRSFLAQSTAVPARRRSRLHAAGTGVAATRRPAPGTATGGCLARDSSAARRARGRGARVRRLQQHHLARAIVVARAIARGHGRAGHSGTLCGSLGAGSPSRRPRPGGAPARDARGRQPRHPEPEGHRDHSPERRPRCDAQGSRQDARRLHDRKRVLAGGRRRGPGGRRRVAGTTPETLLPAFVAVVQGSSATKLTVSELTLGGHDVTQVGAPGQLAQGPLYAYPKDDMVLFVQTPDPKLAEEALAKMP